MDLRRRFENKFDGFKVSGTQVLGSFPSRSKGELIAGTSSVQRGLSRISSGH